MASVNKVILIGNLTRDPELRYTPKGTAVSELGLAVNRKYRVDDDLREETTFVDVTFWGAQAETISKYLQKGAPLYVEGRLQLDSWEDKTSGQRRSKLRVVGEAFQFLGGGRREDSAPGPMASSRTAATDSAGGSAPSENREPSSGDDRFDEEEEEDDIPF